MAGVRGPRCVCSAIPESECAEVRMPRLLAQAGILSDLTEKGRFGRVDLLKFRLGKIMGQHKIGTLPRFHPHKYRGPAPSRMPVEIYNSTPSPQSKIRHPKAIS